jgi:hypothetical protein
MRDPLERVRRAFPAAFPRLLSELLHGAFGESVAISRSHAEEPERIALLGQARHVRCEAAFRRTANECGLAAKAPHTNPLGGRYSVISSGDVVLIRNTVRRDCGPPRWARFRSDLAKLNAWLDAQQLDLLQAREPPRSDRLCTMLVVSAHHPSRGDPSVPAFIGLGIPRYDLSGWFKLLPLTEWLALHHDAETAARTPQPAPVTVKDKAVPKLKLRGSDRGGAVG